MGIEEFVRATLGKDASGHGYDHALRVLSFAEAITKEEGGDEAYIRGCALLHDCLDSKLGLDNATQEERVYACLLENGYDEKKANAMIRTMSRMSFHLHDESDLSLEDKIVRDADRLDALGKIGATRALEYGKSKGRPLFSDEDRKNIAKGIAPHGQSTIAHFFDKLLILDRYLYTDTAKKMALPLKEELRLCLKGLFEENGMRLNPSILPD